jgi:vancomycin resistance protein YoaR
MNIHTDTHPALGQQKPSTLSRIVTAIISGFFIFTGMVVFFMLFIQLIYSGRVFPGVRVGGVDIGGTQKNEVESVLFEKITYPNTGLIVVSDSGQTWLFTPTDLGLFLDTEATAKAAYQIGRTIWPWEAWDEIILTWRNGKNIPPLMIYDERIAQNKLNEIAAQINQPPREASLGIRGLEVTAEPGQVGRMVDMETALKDLRELLYSQQDGNLTLSMKEFTPSILNVSAQAALAQSIIDQPLTLTIPGASENDPGPWVFDRESLASMLTISLVNIDGVDQYQVGLDSNKLYNILYPLTPGLAKDPVNARFVFNDETKQLELNRKAVIGRELMVEESIQYINQELVNGAHEINLVFDFRNPPVTDDATAEELGIKELVSEQSTYFYGSSDARIQNIRTASAQFHGLLIAPGDTFSMVENIGEIDLDSGYAEALIIYGDRTIQGVGGGVCQVSTTLFRTVFYGGFPVVERYPHAYRVTYYEKTRANTVNEQLAGLDATVYAPLIDFKFTNDTPYWMLMETYVDVPSRVLTWKFYSTSDGRSVDWSTTGLKNIVKPDFPIFEENEDLKKGKIEKVDWAVDGADVIVTRTVWRDGQILYDDEFKTEYRPWRAVCQYGPGTKKYPPPENKQSRYSCQPQNN